MYLYFKKRREIGNQINDITNWLIETKTKQKQNSSAPKTITTEYNTNDSSITSHIINTALRIWKTSKRSITPSKQNRRSVSGTRYRWKILQWIIRNQPLKGTKLMLIDVHTYCWGSLSNQRLILSKSATFIQTNNPLSLGDMCDILVPVSNNLVRNILHAYSDKTKSTMPCKTPTSWNRITLGSPSRLTSISFGDVISKHRRHDTQSFLVTIKILYTLIHHLHLTLINALSARNAPHW